MLTARIIVEAPKGGKRRLLCYDPLNLRTVDTNMKVDDRQDEVDRAVRSLKQTLERSGSHVDVLVR